MNDLEMGKDKIQQICQQIRYETLEPAKHEAEEIIKRAHTQAQQIVKHAEVEAQRLLEAHKSSIEKEKALAQSTLEQSFKQVLSALKQQIQHQLFQPALESFLQPTSQEPATLARLIDTIVQAIDKQGLSAHLSAFIPAAVPAQEVNELLVSKVLSRLQEGGVVVEGFKGGVKVRWHEKHLVIDLTDETLKELVAQYVSKDFHHLIFLDL